MMVGNSVVIQCPTRGGLIKSDLFIYQEKRLRELIPNRI